MSKVAHFWRVPLALLLFFSLAILLLPHIAVVPLRAQTEAPYEVAETKNVMVAMRDGVRLATDVYRPARNGTPVDGKFPVLLERTPYNKEVWVAAAPATTQHTMHIQKVMLISR